MGAAPTGYYSSWTKTSSNWYSYIDRQLQVPGQKPAAEPAKTAQDIAAKTGAATPTKKPDLKIAGQKVKPTDPLYDKLVAMIPAETRSSIDGLSDYDKGRLKKELSA